MVPASAVKYLCISGENGFTQAVVIHSGTTAENVAANTGQNILQVLHDVMCILTSICRDDIIIFHLDYNLYFFL